MSEAAPQNDPKSSDRADATAVLLRLRDMGHIAYFAGGCVRDLLLGREPKDWDIATDAPPARVREIFPRTQAVGAAFGVILVRQGKSQVEVATFRTDGRYIDGRHPQGVTFSNPEEDAKRRDFTINGLFLDPVNDLVIDYVGGQADLAAKVIRAIGDPRHRFDEDYLRMLRAVRFAARLNFEIEPATATAIQVHSALLTRISPERIADELRVMLAPPTRVAAWRLMHVLGLLTPIFRFVEVPAGEPDDDRTIDRLFEKLPAEPLPFSLVIATAAAQWLWWASPAGSDIRRSFEKPVIAMLVGAVRKSLKLSNDECDSAGQTLEGLHPLLADDPPTVAILKRFLARPTAGLSRTLLAALNEANLIDESRYSMLQQSLAEMERTDFAPQPFITGDDLTATGMRPGPVFRQILDAAYDAQLEGRLASRDEALRLAKELERTAVVLPRQKK
ncbi:CCA tRNA nucleotidyltransferase [Humisphaera borealis]|uniref:CCA tRNA nucleotidyltransferase n=1 Tax=Humisphaera borealis TaxID=2807512 RepID=A0A7M2WVW8_9BACT|nr:CCA tRNA nucleotidyltransferase [Humisphaera borealis]QOV89697.1 CCA tRNA nucleotidyltransferase [Humisphaera borealis]